MTQEVGQRGRTLLRTFADSVLSGSNLSRPELTALTAYCRGQDVDAVLVVDTDRPARKTEHHFAIKAQLRKCGVRVESLNQPMIDDTPEGVFLDTILAATNALYPQITGRKTSLSMAQKVQAGWRPGPARLGYRNADNPAPTSANDRRIIIPHEVTGSLVTQAFARYASGRYSLKSLCAEMEPLGLRSAWGGRVTMTSLRKMLGDPFYISRATYKGEVRSWNHQSLTDVETLQKCRLVLSEHNRYADRMRKHTFLLSGLIRCGLCGAPLTASVNERKGKSYYNCPLNRVPHSNAGQNVPVEELDAQVGGLLRSVSLLPKTAEKVVRYARRVVAETHGEVDVKRQELLARRGILENRRERVETLYLDEAATEETYRRQSAQIAESLEKISLEVARLDLSRESNIGVFEQVMRLATNAEAAYLSAPLALKRAYLTLFFEGIVVQDKKIVSAGLTPAFAALLNDHAVFNDNTHDGASSEDLATNKKSLNIIESGTVLETVINSDHWLPAPPEFITLLQGAGYWDRVRESMPTSPRSA